MSVFDLLACLLLACPIVPTEDEEEEHWEEDEEEDDEEFDMFYAASGYKDMFFCSKSGYSHLDTFPNSSDVPAGTSSCGIDRFSYLILIV